MLNYSFIICADEPSLYLLNSTTHNTQFYYVPIFGGRESACRIYIRIKRMDISRYHYTIPPVSQPAQRPGMHNVLNAGRMQILIMCTGMCRYVSGLRDVQATDRRSRETGLAHR